MKAELLVQVDKAQQVFLLAPDGRHLAVPHYEKGVAIFDLQTGKQLALKQSDRFLSAAFTPDGKSLWLGTSGGTAVQLTLPGFEETREVTLAKGRRIDGLAIAPHGEVLAWHEREAEAAGLYDLKAAKSLAQWKGVNSPRDGWDEGPRVHFSPDGSLAIFYQSGVEGLRLMGHDPGGLVLWNIAKGKAETVLRPYVSLQTPGFALGPDWLAYGTRTDDSTWEIRKRDLKKGEEKTLAPARGGHYLDLFASPSGRYLAEWDDEKEGIRLYDLGGKNRPRTLGQRKTRFAGWVASGGAEFLLATDDKQGLALWEPGSGFQATISALVGKRACGAALTPDASRLIVLWGDSPGIGKPVEYHVSVLKVSGFPKK